MDVLQNCTIEGNIVKLPNVQLDRKEYMKIKKSLEGIGGKWKGGKIAGFVFPSDPSELLGKVQEGEKVNLKKEFQFFGTPPELADSLVRLAMAKKTIHGQNTWNSAFGIQSILEPSAGQGAIIEAIRRTLGADPVIHAFELMDTNRNILKEKYSKDRVILNVQNNFLEYTGSKRFDWIIANPPFTKNQDIDHVMHMYTLLKPGGVIVSIVSKSWTLGKQKKQVAFRKWLDNLNAELIDIEAGAFKESGTMVGGKIIVITK